MTTITENNPIAMINTVAQAHIDADLAAGIAHEDLTIPVLYSTASLAEVAEDAFDVLGRDDLDAIFNWEAFRADVIEAYKTLADAQMIPERKVSHVEDGDHEWRVFVEGDTEGDVFSDDEVIAFLAKALDADGDFFEVRTVEAGEAGEAVHFVTLTEGDLHDYSSGGYIRKATRDEVWASANGDKHTGTFSTEIEGVSTVVYVIPA